MVYRFFQRTEVAKKCRPSRVAQRPVLLSARRKATRWVSLHHSGQNCRSPNALSYEQLGSCAEFIEASMEFVRKKHGKHSQKANELLSRHVTNFPTPPNRTTQEKVVASRSFCYHEDKEFIVDSGASLHMVSKNEFTSGLERYHQKIIRTHRHHDRQR